jgi:hypothetical protein
MTEDLFMTKVVVTKSGRSCAFLAMLIGTDRYVEQALMEQNN